MRRTLFTATMALFALAALPASEAWAQDAGTPTRAGTQITNTATVSYSDANNNEYDASADVTLTVAFVAGIVIDGPTTPPMAESPSVGNVIEYTITNIGNDVDSFSLIANPGSGITLTGFRIGETWYEDHADFLAALSDFTLDYQGNAEDNAYQVTVAVRYDVDPDQGDTGLEVTVTSTEDGDESDTETTTITTDFAYSIAVTATPETHSQLPGNATYGADFRVENFGSGDEIQLTATTSDGEIITIISVGGTQGESGNVTVGSGGYADITVEYQIAGGTPAGTAAEITLTATLIDATDAATATITVVQPSVSIEKTAHLDNGGTPGADLADGGSVEPGDNIWYRIRVTNADQNAYAASNVVITDVLHSALEYQAAETEAYNSAEGTPWTLDYNSSSRTVTATLNLDGGQVLPIGASAVVWIKVRVR